jgi:SAM-dependent methyltransferase
VPSGASILELGSGAGRVTHPLVELGYAVTAVDESAEMLARVRGARTVRSTIERLDWYDRVPSERPRPRGTMRLVRADETEPGIRSVTLEYVLPEGIWTQTFR